MSTVTVNIPYGEFGPWPTQAEFHQSKAKFKAFGGGWGCGKTKACCQEAIMLSLSVPNNRGVIGRNSYRELQDTTMATFFEELEAYEKVIGHPLGDPRFGMSNGVPGFNESKMIYKFAPPYSSEVLFRYFEGRWKEGEHLKSLNIGWFFIDEAIDVAYAIYRQLTGRLRLPHGQRVGLLATNPASKSHWIYKRFVEKADENHVLFTMDTEENKALPVDYVDELYGTLDEEEIKRYMRGLWIAFKGLVYHSFDREKHLADLRKFDFRQWKVYIGVDFGYPSPSVMEPAAFNGSEIKLLPDFYKGECNSDDLIEEAKVMHERFQGNELFVADPSGSDIIARMQNAGLNVIPASYRSVSDGIALIRRRFEKGFIQIHEGNKELIQELESYKYKVVDNEIVGEMPEKKYDHAMDAMRYAITEAVGGEDIKPNWNLLMVE
jgi:PBSX family phage terminase large subunit